MKIWETSYNLDVIYLRTDSRKVKLYFGEKVARKVCGEKISDNMKNVMRYKYRLFKENRMMMRFGKEARGIKKIFVLLNKGTSRVL